MSMSSSEEDWDENVFEQQRGLFNSGLDAFVVALRRCARRDTGRALYTMGNHIALDTSCCGVACGLMHSLPPQTCRPAALFIPVVAVAYSIKEVESYMRAILQWQLTHNFLSEIQREPAVSQRMMLPNADVLPPAMPTLRFTTSHTHSNRTMPEVLWCCQTDQAVETGIHLLQAADKLIEGIDELAIIALA
jgi:hypothetical protein